MATHIEPRDVVERRTVAGLFPDRVSAEQAIDALKAADFTGDQIGMALRDPTAQGVEGLLGADVLNHFRVMIDRSAGRLTLVAMPPKPRVRLIQGQGAIHSAILSSASVAPSDRKERSKRARGHQMKGAMVSIPLE
jgi:hypothetical protein